MISQIKQVKKKLLKKFHWFINFLNFGYRSIPYPKKISCNGFVRLRVSRDAVVSLEDNIHLNSSWKANPSGGEHTVFYVESSGKLLIGNNTGISNSTIVCHDCITIGSNVNIGVNCVIYDTDMHSVGYRNRVNIPDVYVKTAPIVISDGVWICGHCIILKGVTIGEKSVIAAGSVVSKDIPADELWGGNPARFIRKINVQKINAEGTKI